MKEHHWLSLEEAIAYFIVLDFGPTHMGACATREDSMATLLTADTVTTYVLQNLDKLPEGFFGAEAPKSLTASAIQGGNVNYAFVVSSGDKKVFVKQAPEFVAIFGPDGFPLTSERMQKEMNVYREWKDMLKEDRGFLPEIYFFDSTFDTHNSSVKLTLMHGVASVSISKK